MLDCDSGEVVEQVLRHEGNAVREFYAALPRPVVVGIEATGSTGWFLQLLSELDITCQVGHPAAIRRAETRRQKHDRRDAALLLELLRQDRFPARRPRSCGTSARCSCTAEAERPYRRAVELNPGAP